MKGLKNSCMLQCKRLEYCFQGAINGIVFLLGFAYPVQGRAGVIRSHSTVDHSCFKPISPRKTGSLFFSRAQEHFLKAQALWRSRGANAIFLPLTADCFYMSSHFTKKFFKGRFAATLQVSVMTDLDKVLSHWWGIKLSQGGRQRSPQQKNNRSRFSERTNSLENLIPESEYSYAHLLSFINRLPRGLLINVQQKSVSENKNERGEQWTKESSNECTLYSEAQANEGLLTPRPAESSGLIETKSWNWTGVFIGALGAMTGLYLLSWVFTPTTLDSDKKEEFLSEKEELSPDCQQK